MCDTLPTVLNLATAGDIDLASASDMVTTNLLLIVTTIWSTLKYIKQNGVLIMDNTALFTAALQLEITMA